MKWAYGVTSVPQRFTTLLPRTLKSLAEGGFPEPRLFLDGVQEGAVWQKHFSLLTTCRWPTIRSFGNWVLGLAELYIREPLADSYAMFQDDLIMSRNVRQYLEKCCWPKKSYLNLYTFPHNQRRFERIGQTGRFTEGWRDSNGRGYGALALVFSREALLLLLANQHTVERPMHPVRGWQFIDGGAVWAMKKVGWREAVHNPSLVEHTGYRSTMRHGKFPPSESFRGEEFDACSLAT